VSAGELVPSVSIANLVNQREAVLDRIRQAFDLIQEAADIAAEAHLGMPDLSISTGSGYRNSGRRIARARLGSDRAGARYEREADDRGELDKMARLGVDAAAWQYLMHQSGMRSLMDATAREKWDKAIVDGDIPELTEANIRSTFRMLHDSRGEMFERGVIACFKSLAWCYKTNLPQKFGKRIVVRNISGAYYGDRKADELDDLQRVMAVLDGKPEADHRNGVRAALTKCGIRWGYPRGVCETDYLAIRCFKNNNGHITFKRHDLVEKMNKIIAKHYPGALPAPK
jgi:hypothetical protein